MNEFLYVFDEKAIKNANQCLTSPSPPYPSLPLLILFSFSRSWNWGPEKVTFLRCQGKSYCLNSHCPALWTYRVPQSRYRIRKQFLNLKTVHWPQRVAGLALGMESWIQKTSRVWSRLTQEGLRGETMDIESGSPVWTSVAGRAEGVYVKKVKYTRTMMEREPTLRGEHRMQYIHDALQTVRLKPIQFY